jgi:hypothetical protein
MKFSLNNLTYVQIREIVERISNYRIWAYVMTIASGGNEYNVSSITD